MCHRRMNRAEPSTEIPSEENKARQSSRSVTSWPFLLPSDWMQTDRCHRESPEDTNPTNTHRHTHTNKLFPLSHLKIMKITGGREMKKEHKWRLRSRCKRHTSLRMFVSSVCVVCMPILLRTKSSLKDRKQFFSSRFSVWEWLLAKSRSL